MARRLPSLNALKAFEAAARHESFTDAAEELFVTHAAISRHIRDLEEWLGTELFLRTGRGVALTEAGRRFGERLTPLFDAIAAATREAAAVGDARQLRVSIEPAFASRWLVPRLGRFNDLHPTSNWPSTPTASSPTSAPRGRHRVALWPGRLGHVEALKLTDTVIFPVASPDLHKDHKTLKPGDLHDFNLLHESRKQWWTDWLAAAG